MRISILLILAIFVIWSAPRDADAQAPNSCKQCSDQRRTCMSNYSGPTCQTEYDRCMKTCQKK
jgi:hypothetical protein